MPAIRPRAALLALAAAAPIASAQWTPTVLHPAHGTSSRAWGVHAGGQFGWVALEPGHGNERHAGTWNGSAASWLDHDPSFSSGGSRMYGSDGVQHVGVAFVEPAHVAVLWDAAAGTCINLHPEGLLWSVATGVQGGQQSGWVEAAGSRHAGVWFSTAESFRDLHPEGAEQSAALGVHSGTQVGWATFEGVSQAGRWAGTPDSWRSLHPVGAEGSQALAVFASTQVGFATFDGVDHAGMWSGDAGSWVDLHPALADGPSEALGAFADLQVGFARFDGLAHAALWRGSAGTWIDLHAALPDEFINSTASGVWTDGSTVGVVGWGRNSATGRDEALLWTLPAPGTASLVLGAGACMAPARRRR